jgi:DNA repair photolyase
MRQSKDTKIDLEPRRNVLFELEKDCKKYYNSNDQVFLSFMTDPYNAVDQKLRLTREALKLFYSHKIPVSILTKSGEASLIDLDLFKKFGSAIKVGATLTFSEDEDSKKYEPDAALPAERLSALKKLKAEGVTTWASFEPVIIPQQSIELIETTLNDNSVDYYKIGKINNYRGIDKDINWSNFLSEVVKLLRDHGKPFYVKHDLRINAPDIKLFGNETSMDEFNTRWDE